jgi:two-component sensor histidine kinase
MKCIEKIFFYPLLVLVFSTSISAQQFSKANIEKTLLLAYDLNFNKPDSARTLFEKIKPHIKASDWHDLQIDFDLYYGDYFNEINNYDSSLYYLNQVMKRCKKHDSLEVKLGVAYSFLSELYQNALNYPKALAYAKRSIVISEKYQLSETYIDYHNLSLIYSEYGEDSLAIWALNKSAELAPKDNDEVTFSINTNLALMLVEGGRYAEARKLLTQIEDFLRKDDIETINNRFNGTLIYANYYMEVDSLDKALSMIHHADSLAKQLKIAEINMFLSEAYADYYIAIGDFELAYDYRMRSQEITDSLDGADVQKNLNELQTKYATAEKERKISEQTLKIRENENRKRLYQVVIGFISGILLLLFYFYLNSSKKRKLLHKKNQQIEEAHTAIENLMRESHHRIKNNLQVVSSLLKIQSKNARTQEAKSGLLEAYSRISTIALLHQKLQGSEGFEHINSKDFLGQLIPAIQHSLAGENKVNKFEIDLEKINISMDSAISIGLIVNELLTNAIKYAFQDQKEVATFVRISLKKQTSSLTLIVADNGKGLPDDFNIDGLKSLGFKIVRSMASKLKATVFTKNDNGAVIEINIPYEGVA